MEEIIRHISSIRNGQRRIKKGTEETTAEQTVGQWIQTPSYPIKQCNHYFITSLHYIMLQLVKRQRPSGCTTKIKQNILHFFRWQVSVSAQKREGGSRHATRTKISTNILDLQNRANTSDLADMQRTLNLTDDRSTHFVFKCRRLINPNRRHAGPVEGLSSLLRLRTQGEQSTATEKSETTTCTENWKQQMHRQDKRNKQTSEQKLIDADHSVVVTGRQDKGAWGAIKSKKGQIHGDGMRFDFDEMW